MEADKPSLSELTLAALGQALENDHPVRLKSSAAKPGLLPGGPQTAAKKAAAKECLDPVLGLFEKTGSEADPLVRITRAGVVALLDGRTPLERTAVLEKTAVLFKPVVNEVAFQLAETELKATVARQVELSARAAALRDQLTGMVRGQLADVESLLSDLSSQAGQLRKMTQVKSLPQPGTVVETGTAPPPRDPQQPAGRAVPKAETDADTDFQRDLCRELALTWQDTPEPEARQALERVMFNTGLEPIGEVGEVLPFDAGQHDLPAATELIPGRPVEVLEPGWQFTSHRGVLRIVRARVAPAEEREDHTSAAHA